MLDKLLRILRCIYENEGLEGGVTTLEFLSKNLEMEKDELYKILKELEKEGYLEERKFLNDTIPNDFSLENKGIRLMVILQGMSKEDWLKKFTI